MRYPFLALISSVAFAQAPPTPGAITGIIRDTVGKPLSHISLVLVGAPSGRQTAATSEQGEFHFSNLPPALYRLTAQGQSEVLGTKAIPLDTGQTATVNMTVAPSGAISGRVLDENREPVAGIGVVLLASVYQAGEQAYEAQFGAVSDRQGKYRLPGVKPGLSYRVLASYTSRQLKDAPADRDAREPELARAYFPNAPTAEAAGPFVLFPGEQREAADIRLARRPPRCVEAILQTPAGRPAPDLDIFIFDSRGAQLASGKSGADGRIRHCLPERIELRITAHAGPLTGTVTVPAGDEDVTDLRLVLQPPPTLRGVIELEGDAPPPDGGTISVALERPGADQVKSAIPGQFSLPAQAADVTLSMTLANMPKGSYIKTVTCAGVPLIAKRLRLEGVTGAPELRIVIARDGGSLGVLVQDADGKPVPDAWALAWPASAASEREMSISLWAGVTNGSGAFVDAIKPGKYLVLAATTFLTLNTETIARYWVARGKATEVEIGPNASVNVTLPLTNTAQ